MIGCIYILMPLGGRAIDSAGNCLIGVMHKINIVACKAERQLLVG